MNLTEVEYTRNLDATLRQMAETGLLLSSMAPEQPPKPNVMTIGWGNVGILWGRPVFTVYVRPSRFTFGCIEASDEFVVSVPTEQMRDVCMEAGSLSGRDVDKFARLGLTALEAAKVGAPLIGECVRHYECRVIHCNDVVDAEIDPAARADFYPEGNLHRIYYGQILRVTEKE